MIDFQTGYRLLGQTNNLTHLSTGSPELDLLVGGLRPGLTYLFYGEKHLIEEFFRHTTVSALKTNEKGAPVVAYMLMGNYRKERTELGLEELADLAEDNGFHMWEALSRVRIFTASSADQQVQLAEELETFLNEEDNVSLLLVRGIFKLYHDDARKRNRHVVREEVQRSISRLSQICAERGVPLVASGREAGIRVGLLLGPESSSYLRHTANVIVCLQARGRDSLYNRAFRVDHPLRAPGSIEYAFKVDDNMGRETRPFRQSFQEVVERLRRELREPLVDTGRKTAFDHLLEAWAAEQGAMSYAESFKILDLIIVVSALENRRLLADAVERLDDHEERLRGLMEG